MPETTTPELVEVNLGTVTSYGIALENGFTGTHEQWVQKIIGGASQADLDALAAEVHYVPLTIDAFAVAPSSVEMGTTVTELHFYYALSKGPDSLWIDSMSVTPQAAGIYVKSGLSVNEDRTYEMKAVDDEHPEGITKTAKISFHNRICWGAAAIPGTVNSEFLLGLANTELSEDKERTINANGAVEVNAGSGQYIWYAVPKRLGICEFFVGGFNGGFEPAQTVSVTNASEYTEDYYVYRSTNPGLGSPEIVVV